MLDDVRCPELIEHQVVTLVGQRVFGIALGYEDLNDHDELRHDPMLAVLSGKLAARREDCAPVAGKSTLNRLELSRLEPTRYHKIMPAASRLRWRQRVRQPIPGAALPNVSPLPPTRGPRPPDTRRRNA